MRPEIGQCTRYGSSTRPLCFNDVHKPLVALRDGDASVSLAALRKAGSSVPPLLGALPVSFENPRHLASRTPAS